MVNLTEENVQCLEELTVNAFETLKKAIHFRNQFNISNSINLYKSLKQKLYDIIGACTLGKKTVPNTEIVDRYLLQQTLGLYASIEMRDTYQKPRSINLSSTSHFKFNTLEKIITIINDKNDPKRYYTIKQLSKYLIKKNMQTILVQAIEYVQENYKKPEHIIRQQQKQNEENNLESWVEANLDFFKYIKRD